MGDTSPPIVARRTPRELVVVYGRIGTQGQVNRKPFPTPDLARAEGECLVREKLAMGYEPA